MPAYALAVARETLAGLEREGSDCLNPSCKLGLQMRRYCDWFAPCGVDTWAMLCYVMPEDDVEILCGNHPCASILRPCYVMSCPVKLRLLDGYASSQVDAMRHTMWNCVGQCAADRRDVRSATPR